MTITLNESDQRSLLYLIQKQIDEFKETFLEIIYHYVFDYRQKYYKGVKHAFIYDKAIVSTNIKNQDFLKLISELYEKIYDQFVGLIRKLSNVIGSKGQQTEIQWFRREIDKSYVRIQERIRKHSRG